MPVIKLQHRPRHREATRKCVARRSGGRVCEKGLRKYDDARDRAGSSEVLIQRYFSGKEGLLLAVLRRNDNVARLDSFLERPFVQDPGR